MAKVESTTISTTAACDTGRCGSCRGVVFSLTDAHLTDCQHGCHAPEPIEDDELDDLLAEDADRRLDQDQDQDQTRQAVASWHEQRERHRGHHHAANETCTVPALDQAQTAPEESVRSAPEESDFGVSTGSDHGQGDHAGRGQDGKRPDRDNENDRKRERYWHELTKDRPGEEWS
jgi:hypothetical protein